MMETLIRVAIVFVVLAVTSAVGLMIVTGRAAKQLVGTFLVTTIAGAILAAVTAYSFFSWNMFYAFGPHAPSSISFLILYVPALVVAFFILRAMPRVMFYVGLVGCSVVPIGFLSAMSVYTSSAPERHDWHRTFLLFCLALAAGLFFPPRSHKII